MRLGRLLFFVCWMVMALEASADEVTLERLGMESRVEALRQDAKAMHIARDWSTGDSFLSEANALLTSLDEDLKITLQHEMVTVLVWMTRYDDAKTLLQDTLQMAKQADNVKPKTLAQLRFEMGKIAGRQGDYVTSLASFQKAYSIHKENNLPASPDHLSAIAAVTHFMGQNEKALEIYDELGSLPDLKDASLMRVLTNKGAILVELKQYERSLENFQAAVTLSEKTGINAPNLPQNMGYLYVMMGEYDKALVLLEQALNEYQQNNQKTMMAVSRKSIGETYLRLGELQRAIEYLSLAYQGIKDKGLVKQELEFYPVYIEALEAAGDYQQALVYFKEFKALSDKTNDLEAKNYAENLQANFDLTLEQERVAQLEKNQLLQQESLEVMRASNKATEKANRVMQLLSGMLSLFLIVVVGLLAYRRQITRRLTEKNTQIQTLNEELKKLSFHDPLTQLHNRNYLEQKIPHEISLAKRYAERSQTPKWMLVILDIDHFKQFNDQYGHIEGDNALKHFARNLQACARQSDIIARWGGEEFIWLCHDTDYSQIKELFGRLQQNLQKDTLSIGSEAIGLTFSAGASELLLNDSLSNIWTASIELADAALYRAKRDGRDRWYAYQIQTYCITDGKLDIAAVLEQDGAIEHC